MRKIQTQGENLIRDPVQRLQVIRQESDSLIIKGKGRVGGLKPIWRTRLVELVDSVCHGSGAMIWKKMGPRLFGAGGSSRCQSVAIPKDIALALHGVQSKSWSTTCLNYRKHFKQTFDHFPITKYFQIMRYNMHDIEKSKLQVWSVTHLQSVKAVFSFAAAWTRTPDSVRGPWTKSFAFFNLSLYIIINSFDGSTLENFPLLCWYKELIITYACSSLRHHVTKEWQMAKRQHQLTNCRLMLSGAAYLKHKSTASSAYNVEQLVLLLD